ncbi:hypothetical protein MAR_003472, partial [Mya arenaria]
NIMATAYRQTHDHPKEYFVETDTDTEDSDFDDFVCSDSGKMFQSQGSEKNDQPGKLLCEVQTEENIAEIFAEIRKEYKPTEAEWRVSNIDERKDHEAASLLDDAFESLSSEVEKSGSIEGCSSCAESVNVLDVSQFKKGQHISMPGKFGTIYQHHAIVCDVKSTSGTKAELELIHFENKDKSIRIRKGIKTYDLKNKQIYLKHYKKQSSTSVVQLLIYTFAVPAIGSGVGIPLVVLSVLLSVALKMSVNTFLRVLRNPFGKEKTKLSRPSQLSIADIVAFSYYRLEHVAIVTDILDVNERAQTARVRCIHYGLPKLLAKRQIVEEEFEMNLVNSSWHKFDVDDTTSYACEKRLSRARERVGEKRWSKTNRSDNFCHWAVVPIARWDNYAFEEVNVKEKKNKSVEPFFNKYPVYIAEELRLGDVVDYKETGVLHIK